jgi:transposase
VTPVAKRFVLAHPGKLRVIAESTRKSDKLDAQVLAEFLALDMIPPAYRPTARQREHRVLVRHRTQVAQQCSRVKCQIRRLLSNYNADRRDVFTAAAAAVARRLLCVLVSLWKSGKPYAFAPHERPRSEPTAAELAEMAESEAEQEPVFA